MNPQKFGSRNFSKAGEKKPVLLFALKVSSWWKFKFSINDFQLAWNISLSWNRCCFAARLVSPQNFLHVWKEKLIFVRLVSAKHSAIKLLLFLLPLVRRFGQMTIETFLVWISALIGRPTYTRWRFVIIINNWQLISLLAKHISRIWAVLQIVSAWSGSCYCEVMSVDKWGFVKEKLPLVSKITLWICNNIRVWFLIS